MVNKSSARAKDAAITDCQKVRMGSKISAIVNETGLFLSLAHGKVQKITLSLQINNCILKPGSLGL